MGQGNHKEALLKVLGTQGHQDTELPNGSTNRAPNSELWCQPVPQDSTIPALAGAKECKQGAPMFSVLADLLSRGMVTKRDSLGPGFLFMPPTCTNQMIANHTTAGCSFFVGDQEMGDSILAGSVHECGRLQGYQNSGCSFIPSDVASVSAGGNRAPTTVGSLQDQSPEPTH